MKKIFKYKLNYTTVPEIVRLPRGAKVIDFDRQGMSVQLWAMVEPNNEIEKRVFMLAFTGQELLWKVKEAFGTRLIKETGIVIHLLELEDVLHANDPETDDRLKT